MALPTLLCAALVREIWALNFIETPRPALSSAGEVIFDPEDNRASDWVYVPAADKKFRRVEVVGGDPLPGNLQQIKSGIKPAQQVIANAAVLEHTIAISQ